MFKSAVGLEQLQLSWSHLLSLSQPPTFSLTISIFLWAWHFPDTFQTLLVLICPPSWVPAYYLTLLLPAPLFPHLALQYKYQALPPPLWLSICKPSSYYCLRPCPVNLTATCVFDWLPASALLDLLACLDCWTVSMYTDFYSGNVPDPWQI